MLLTPLLPSARRQQKFVWPFELKPLAVLCRRSGIIPVFTLALFGSLVLTLASCRIASAQTAPPAPLAPQDTEKGLLLDWAGLQVVSINFDGVSADLLKPLPTELAQQPGTPLDPQKIRVSLRSLFATGLYQTIEVAGVRAGDSVTIVFTGVPRLFVGRVNVEGVKDDRLDAVLDSATQLQAGTPYSETRAAQAEPAIKTTLENNGYYRGQIARTTVIDHANSLVDLNFEIFPGDPARVIRGQVY